MDKKTIIGVVLMSAIFIVYMVFTSRQQAEYQEYLKQVQAEEQLLQAEQTQTESSSSASAEPVSAEDAAAAALQREIDLFGESLHKAKSLEAEQFTMQNDYLSVEFTTQGAMMQKVTLAEYTKYAPKGERNEKVVLFDPQSAYFDMEFYVKRNLRNVKVNTSEYVFASKGVVKSQGKQTLTMALEVAEGAYLEYEYVLYDEKNPSRDYMLDFNVKFVNLSPIMAQQSTVGLAWSNRTYQNERSFQLMAQVAGRAGRRGSQGLVILQTRNTDLPVIHQVMANDYASLYEEQATERQYFHYPPFCRLIYIYLRGRDEVAVIHAAEAMATGMRRYFAERVLGPEPPAVARVQSLHIRKLMLKVEPSLGVTQVRHCLYGVQQELLQQGLLHNVTLYYDVDPY